LKIKLQKLLLLAFVLGLAILFVVNASQPGRHVEGCPSTCATALPHRTGPLLLVSLNMLHGFPDFKNLPVRLRLIALELRRLDPDVVLLNEVPWTVKTGSAAAYLGKQLGFNYLYYRESGNRWLIFFEEGEVILSRFPLDNVAFTKLSPRVSLFEQRVALAATALTPWGDLTFVVTHLTDKASQKNLAMEESLQEFVQAMPADLRVVAGDFNAVPDSPQIRRLDLGWQDAFRLANPDEPGLTCCIADLSSPVNTLDERIDYVFLATHSGLSGRVLSARLILDQPFNLSSGWQWASDHVGLLVEIEP
jgi:endonuclease/exonuclease/phosphatase family metal-dependent hydrolase